MTLSASIVLALAVISAASPVVLQKPCHEPTTTSPAPQPSGVNHKDLTANDIITIDPSTKSCPSSGQYASECATAAVAAPAIVKAFRTFHINTFGEQAAVLSLMLYESGSFKYNKNHYPAPGTPGQGTRNMQSPAFNAEYAQYLADHRLTKDEAGKPKTLTFDELIASNRWSFGSAAWFLKTQCSEEIRKGLTSESRAGWDAYLTTCVGTTSTDDRAAIWEKVIAY